MADEAAEDVANSGDLDEWGDDDEMYAKLTGNLPPVSGPIHDRSVARSRYAKMTEKALRIASSQTTTKLKQAFGPLSCLFFERFPEFSPLVSTRFSLIFAAVLEHRHQRAACG